MQLGSRWRRRSSPKAQRQLEDECRSPQEVLEVRAELNRDAFAKFHSFRRRGRCRSQVAPENGSGEEVWGCQKEALQGLFRRRLAEAMTAAAGQVQTVPKKFSHGKCRQRLGCHQCGAGSSLLQVSGTSKSNPFHPSKIGAV